MRPARTAASVLALIVVIASALAWWWLRDERGLVLDAAANGGSTTAVAPPSPAPAATEPGASVARRAPDEDAVAPIAPTVATPAASATALVTLVRKEDGRPLPFVRLKDRNADVDLATDGAGRVTLERAAGDDVLLRCFPGRDDADAQDLFVPPLSAGERREVTWSVFTGADVEFHGVALARAAGSKELLPTGDETPIGGALVTLVEEDVAPTASRTDAHGAFVVHARSWRRPRIDVSADGFGPASTPIRGDHGSAAKPELILLAPAATLRARVVDARGRGISGAQIKLSVQREHVAQPAGATLIAGAFEWSLATDGEGRAEFPGLPPDAPVDVAIHAEGMAPLEQKKAFALAAGEVAEREFRLGGLARIVGALVDQDGAPIGPAALVAVPRDDVPRKFMGTELLRRPTRKHANTDDLGNFAFDGIPTGAWWIAVDPRDFTSPHPSGMAPASPNLLAVDVPELSTEVRVTLVAWRGLFVRVRVTDEHGTLLAGTTLHARLVDDDFKDALVFASGEDGTFTLGPLPPVTVDLHADGMDLGRGFSESPHVQVIPGGPDVALVVARPGGVLVGRVVDAKTRAPADAWISAMFDGSTVFASNAEVDGRFRLDTGRAGKWSLYATTDDVRFAFLGGIDVEAGVETRELLLELVPGATLVLLPPHAMKYGSYRVLRGEEVVADDALVAGRPARVTVPPGNLRVRFVVDQEAPRERAVSVVAGETLEVRAE